MPTPPLQFLADRKFPFTVTWAEKEVDHEVVCACPSSAARAGWVKAINATIKRISEKNPTRGWLTKAPGRHKGYSLLSGWKRRWFVIQSPTYQSPDAVFRYYETPTAPEPKGAVVSVWGSAPALASPPHV